MQIFVFLQPMWCQEQSDLSAAWTFKLQEGLTEKTQEKRPLDPLDPCYRRSDFLLQHLSFKIKKTYLLLKLAEMEQNWITLTPYIVLSKIFNRSIHVIATWNSQEKIKLTILHEQNHVPWLVKNDKTVFSKLMWQISLSVSGNQVSRQAKTWLLAFLSQIFRYFPDF